MTPTRLLSFFVFALAVGCGGAKHSKADVERGQNALTAALDAWKNNEPPDRLKSLPEPIEYTDELRLTHKLLDYTLGKPNPTDPEVVRYPVKLRLQERKGKGKVDDRDVVFEIKLKTPILIARDPYE